VLILFKWIGISGTEIKKNNRKFIFPYPNYADTKAIRQSNSEYTEKYTLISMLDFHSPLPIKSSIFVIQKD